MIGVFDRSHYEDVPVPAVHDQIDHAELHRRFAMINNFENELTEAGTSVIKCFLNISYDQQRERLLARLDDPAKHGKFNEGDITERHRWADYQDAYAAALAATSTKSLRGTRSQRPQVVSQLGDRNDPSRHAC